MYSHYYYPNELYHHGVKGQKWGVRRFQNRDGSLTSAGERHRDQIDGSSSRSSGGSAKSASRKKKLKRILGVTLGAAAAGAAGYYGGKYLGKKLVDSGRITPEKYHNAIDRLKGLPGKAKYGVGYAQGTASRLGKSAREGASKYGALAKNFAKAGVSKAKYGAGYAHGTVSRLGRNAGRTIANNAKILGYNAQGKYYDTRARLSGSNAYRKLRTAASIAGDKATSLGARATTSAIYRSQKAGNAVRGLASRVSNSTAGSRARILGETARGLASGAKERYYKRKLRRYS